MKKGLVLKLKRKEPAFTFELLLEHLHNLQQKLGRTPSAEDVDLAHTDALRMGKRFPSSSVYYERFDGLNDALKNANINPANNRRSSSELAYTRGGIRAELLKFIADCRSRGEKVSPTSLHYAIHHSGKIRISPAAFKRHYGNEGNALLILGAIKVRRGSIANGPPLTSPRARR